MPDLDRWLPEPGLQVHHERTAHADPDRLWAAARAVRVDQTGFLGRLIRWRLPGTPPELEFDALFRSAPFVVLDEGDHCVVSGMAGRIWTLRRDYPTLENPRAFVQWQRRGTVRVLFAHWVTSGGGGTSMLHSEVRVSAIGSRGSLGLRAVRPLVGRFHSLIGSEGIAAAVRVGEGGGE
ncbi:MAG TPA: hypothetical protein VLP43_03645 [Solirubrobacteraceae bacterium]|nr:hypothetical protein [Solirubrobacteraceae bacterium]